MKDAGRNTLILIVAVLIISALVSLNRLERRIPSDIDSFISCAESGYPILESYPRQCRTPDGRSFAENIPGRTEEYPKVNTPLPGSIVSKTFIVSGEAPGTWFFEASFPVSVIDQNGNTLVDHYATALGEWMTTDFVPFEAEITLPKEALPGRGSVVLKKDNPSGLPELDLSLSIPVVIQ